MVVYYKQLSRFLVALTVALAWLTLMGLPEVGLCPEAGTRW